MSKKVSVSKKVVAKKSVKKKTTKVTKNSSKKPLVYANDQASFWVKDGQILNSLKALSDALSKMEPEVFSHHVSKEKNDFANWVDAVLDDKDCAVQLRKAKTQKTAAAAVNKYLKNYAL